MRRALAALALTVALGAAALAAPCEPETGFESWLDTFKREAAAAGISQRAIGAAFAGVAHDPKIIGYDRNQKVFRQTFEEFSGRMISLNRLQKGGKLLTQHGALLDNIEKEFGVAGPLLVAIWGLETNYGADTSGRFSIIRSLATLAYDCRRSQFFTGQLLDAIRIVQRGDMTPSQMRGGWAGEIGQTQFLPTPYVKYAVDFDGDGRRDLVRSVPDILASTANFLKAHGWRAGQSWEPGSANYAVIRDWNRAEVYQRTISVMATKLRGERSADRAHGRGMQ